jgi:hypothetical protein
VEMEKVDAEAISTDLHVDATTRFNTWALQWW